MEPILTIDNLNSFGGNMLRQGDKSQLKYRLRDIGNKNLNISGKSCEIKMYGHNYTTVVYETTTTVSSDNTVSFTINKVLPKGTFYLEFTVGDYIFPTDHREYFELTPSGKGVDAKIIEIVGKDVLIRTVKSQVDTELRPLVTSLQSAEQAEAQRVLVENERSQKYASYAQQFNDVIIELSEEKDYHSLPEIAGARGGHETLGERLDKEHNEVTTQLAHTVPISVKTFGATGLGLVDDTQAFVDAIEYAKSVGNKHIFVPDGTYLIDTVSGVDEFGRIRIPSGFTFEMSNHAYLKAIPTSSTHYSILCTENDFNNITIKGGNLIGDRSEHEGETGEQGYGIFIGKGDTITVENVNISDCWGDGIITYGYFTPNPVNVTIKNNVIDNCRRQGISIAGGNNVKIYGNTIKNTNGTAPQYGIDIEDDSQDPDNGYTINVDIYDNYFQDNTGGSINILTSHGVKVRNNVTVYTKPITVSDFGAAIHSAWNSQRSIITGNIIEGNGFIGNGIALKGNHNAIVDGNVISGAGTRTLSIEKGAIYIEDGATSAEPGVFFASKNVTISRNKVIGDKTTSNNYGIVLWGVNCTVESNTVSGQKGTGIYLRISRNSGEIGVATNCVVSHNIIDDIDGVGIDVTLTIGVVVKNNTISNINGNGNGIVGNYANGLTVSKNSIRDISKHPILLTAESGQSNEDCSIDGNVFLNCGDRIVATYSKRLVFSNNIIRNVYTNRTPNDGIPLIAITASFDCYIHHNKVYDDHETPASLAIHTGVASNIVSLNDLRLSNSLTKVSGGTAYNNFEG